MQMLLVAACVVVIIHVSEGFGFGALGGGLGGGGGGGCGCAPPAPACAPAPCAPPPPPICALPPVQNQCCGGPPAAPRCGCRTRRRFKKRRTVRGIQEEVIQISNSTVDDPRCNSKKLRAIILNNVSNDAEASKLAIHDTANKQLGGHYAVICSEGAFTYVADSRVYCIEGNAHVSCYAFQI